MRKIILSSLIFILIISLFSCSNGNETNNTANTNPNDALERDCEVKITKEYTDAQDIPNDLSVEKLLSHTRTNQNGVGNYSVVSIKKDYYKNSAIYFVELQEDFFWSSILYQINFDKGEIVGLIDTGAGGLSEYFQYNLIEISPGSYLAVYCSSHMGNGDLELIPLNEIGEAKYAFPAIDGYYEETELTAIEYGLSSGYGNDILASAVYLCGKLHAEYTDTNNDGNTDIALSGIQQIYETSINGELLLKREYFVRNIYLYAPLEDCFIYNEGLSVKTEIR